MPMYSALGALCQNPSGIPAITDQPSQRNPTRKLRKDNYLFFEAFFFVVFFFAAFFAVFFFVAIINSP